MSDIKTELDVCESEMDNLSEWEQGFIESVSDQFTRTGRLTDKQQSTLHKIYEKVV